MCMSEGKKRNYKNQKGKKEIVNIRRGKKRN